MSAWQWTKEGAHGWYNESYRLGVNFVPSSASNQFEMWMEPDWPLIEEELLWASFLNFNAVRVSLHDQMYANEGDRFWEKIDKFLDLCHEFSIQAVLVVFDSYGDPIPKYGNQEEPIPYVYQSRWVQSPGRAMLLNETAQQTDLKQYVTTLVRRYGNDPRVLMIDLWNDPFQTNDFSYGSEGARVPEAIPAFGTELSPHKKQRLVEALLPQTFSWARSVGDISVPLTVGLSGDVNFRQHPGYRVAIEQSDIISFYNLENQTNLMLETDLLSSHGRPLVCTDFLARSHDSSIAPIAEALRDRNVWAFASGLVQGRTQKQYSPDSWHKVVPCSDVWYQDILHPNGTAFSESETLFLQNYRSLPMESEKLWIGLTFTILDLIGWVWFYVALVMWFGFFTFCWCYCCVLERVTIRKTRRKAAEDQEISPFILSCESVEQPNGTISGGDVAKAAFPRYPTLLSALPFDREARPALASTDRRSPITLQRIQTFVSSDFGPFLGRLGLTRNDRIAVVLPQGPELALAIFATANWASCVPLDITQSPKELEDDLTRCDAKMVIGPTSLMTLPSIEDFRAGQYMAHIENPFEVGDAGFTKPSSTPNIKQIADKLGLPYAGVVRSNDEAGLFRFVGKPKRPQTQTTDIDSVASMSTAGREQLLPTQHTDEALVLITKDDNGTKKLIPHTLGSILVSCAVMGKAWDLKRKDVNCMVMPMLSSCGIVHQFFATLLSGGCAVCCPNTDHFLTLLKAEKFTWFYAESLVHQQILKVLAETKKSASRKSSRSQKTTETLRRLQDLSSLTPGATTLKLRLVVTSAVGLSPPVLDALNKMYEVDVGTVLMVPECVPVATAQLVFSRKQELGLGGAAKSKVGTPIAVPLGIQAGPEIAIFDKSEGEVKRLSEPNKIGSIYVRNTPCFQGYAFDHVAGSQFSLLPFHEDNWFNTKLGGYLDEDGRLGIVQQAEQQARECITS